MRRSFLALLVGAVLAVGGVASWQSMQRSSVAEQRRTTETYVDALQPLAVDAGRVVELGIKDALQQVGAGEASDPALARSARSYARQLTGVRAEIVALDEPAGLDDSGFVEAIDSYVAAARSLEAAALASGAQRSALIDDVTEQGRAADDDWDRAAGAVQDHLGEVGLPKADWLPD